MQEKTDTTTPGAAPAASDPRDDEIARLRAEVKRRDEAARAASAVPSAAPAPAATPAAISITKDDLAALLREAVSQGLAQARAATGARPERPEELHVVEDGAQVAVEGECVHPLSAHEFFGVDGYGRCHVDGCSCTGRELGSAAVRAFNAKNREKAKAGSEKALAVAA